MMICWPEEISAVVYAWIDSLRDKKFIVRLEFFPPINVKKPRASARGFFKEKASEVWGRETQTSVLAIHPRAQHGAFWLFHVRGNPS
jgi:hypothetical protein